MNGIWVRSEDGAKLVSVIEFNITNSYTLCGDFSELATYKTKEAAIKQLDDIQAYMCCSGVSFSVGQHAIMRDGRTRSELHPHVYDLRERKVKEA